MRWLYARDAIAKFIEVKIMLKPRGWQVNAISKFFKSESLCFLAEATPGAGKTVFSGLCAKRKLDNDEIDFVVVVVPTKALKGGKDSGFLGDWTKCGVNLTAVLKDGQGRPKDFNGGIVTYQQLPNIASTFETWARNGVRIMFVFDEIHHASEKNIWGSAAEQCGRAARKILAMTGTPFRGDGRRISFVNYDTEGKANSDYSYSYRRAISENVCREVFFKNDDGIAEYIHHDEEHETRISEANKSDESNAVRVLFNPKVSEWLKHVIVKADELLDDYRVTDMDAGGIIICRPGTDDTDNRHLHQVADLVEKLTGEKPVTIQHEDKDANAKIEAFRRGSSKWICSVRMISEGVDIRRLRVMVMANRPTTELLFRQMVGRVARVENPSIKENSTVFIADFPQLREWAKQIASEAECGLNDPPEVNPVPGQERREKSDFVSIGATHEGGGGISDFGEVFTAEEVAYAENLKRNDAVLSHSSLSAIMHVIRKMEPSNISKYSAPEVPLHIKKTETRGRISTLARRFAVRQNPDNPEFGKAFSLIYKRAGIKNLDDLTDNYSIEKMLQVEALTKSMMKDAGNN